MTSSPLLKFQQSVWSGLVGKGDDQPGNEPISLEEMLALTSAALYQERGFDGFDMILLPPHVDFARQSVEAEARRVAGLSRKYGLPISSIVPAIWGGSAMDTGDGRKTFVDSYQQAIRFSHVLIEEGVRTKGDGVFRYDTSTGPEAFAAGDREANMQTIADTTKQCCDLVGAAGERIAAELEICWGGLASPDDFEELHDKVGRPEDFGLMGDLAHLNLALLGIDQVKGYNADTALLPEGFDPSKAPDDYFKAWQSLAERLRPRCICLHPAQNDGTFHGSGSHDATGRHCLASDAKGWIDPKKIGPLWLVQDGKLHPDLGTVTWDGCMFSNTDMRNPQTWVDVLRFLTEMEDAVRVAIETN